MNFDLIQQAEIVSINPNIVKNNKIIKHKSPFSQILNPKEHSSSSLRGKPGFYTRYKPFLNKDKNVKKLLRNDRQRPAEVENIMLRRLVIVIV